MDSRIEELLCIIVERCNSNIQDSGLDDRTIAYSQVKHLAISANRVLQDYRKEHPEEYGD